MLKKTTSLKKGTSKLRSNSTLKSKGTIKRAGRLKVRKKTDQQLQEIEDQKKKDNQIYEEVWKERGPYSQISGKYLGVEVNKACVDHLLEKSKYPHLRHEKENLYLVTIEEHSMKTAGNPLPSHRQAIEEAKIRFNIA